MNNTTRNNIAWLNWPIMKRSILIGSLSSPCFAIRTARGSDGYGLLISMIGVCEKKSRTLFLVFWSKILV